MSGVTIMECGCEITGEVRPPKHLTIIHCPTHAQAFNLLAALEKYGNHTKSCSASLQPFNETPCDCGWREAYPDIDQARHAAARGGA